MYDWEIIRQVEKQIANGLPNADEGRYCLTGDCIYNLIRLKNLLYEFKVVKNTKSVSAPNDKLTSDAIKNKIINHIYTQIEDYKPQINDGKIYWRCDGISLRVEVGKRMKMPT